MIVRLRLNEMIHINKIEWHNFLIKKNSPFTGIGKLYNELP